MPSLRVMGKIELSTEPSKRTDSSGAHAARVLIGTGRFTREPENFIRLLAGCPDVLQTLVGVVGNLKNREAGNRPAIFNWR